MNTIGKKAIKIACLQVVPGMEFDVARAIRDNSTRLPLAKVVIHKGFGFWDLVVFYEAENFDHILTKAGPIEGILNSISFLCFAYMDEDSNSDALNAIGDSTFVGITLLKMKLGTDADVEIIENKIAGIFNENQSIKLISLRTLGWSELLLVTVSDNCENIISELHRVNFENTDSQHYIDKTFTQICINHAFLPTPEIIKQGRPQIEEYLAAKLAGNINKDISIDLSISSRPEKYRAIVNYWNLQGCCSISTSLGHYDIHVSVDKEISWSSLLAQLIEFRSSFAGSIISTFTTFHKKRPLEEAAPQQESDQTYALEQTRPFFSFDWSELETLFGVSLGTLMANHFYALNSLCQHTLTGQAFDAMKMYPDNILDLARNIKKARPEITLEMFALSTSALLEEGVELRSYGTYGNIKKNFTRFTRLAGGVQRTILAMEFFPNYIFHKIGFKWKGFIVVKSPKFSHYCDVIMVPTESLWAPTRWWALYHEIAHIIIDRSDISSISHEPISNFLKNKNPQYVDVWYSLLIEVLAEIIGFELGFFDDYDTFFEVVWDLLITLEPVQDKKKGLELYLARTFAVELYFRMFSPRSEKRIDEAYFKKFENIFTDFILHIDRVERHIKLLLSPDKPAQDLPDFFSFKDKKLFAALNVELFQELYEIFIYAHNCIQSFADEGRDIKPPYEDLSDKATLDACEGIFQGQVCWREISKPEALLYLLIKRRNSLDFRASMSTILTFWNASREIKAKS